MAKTYSNVSEYLKKIRKPVFKENMFKKEKVRSILQEKITNYENKDSWVKRLIFRYSLSGALVAAVVIIYIVFPGIYNSIRRTSSYYNTTVMTSIKGNIMFKEVGRREVEYSGEYPMDVKLTAKDRIKTGDDSFAGIKIGDNSLCTLNENSEMEIIKLMVDNHRESNKIFLNKGSIDCSISFASSDSVFEIVSDYADVWVKGTDFTFSIDGNENVLLDVREGEVEIGNFIKSDKMDELKKYNANIYSMVYENINSPISVGGNYSLTINKSDLIKLNKDFSIIMDTVLSANDLEDRTMIDNALSLHIKEMKSLRGSMALKINNNEPVKNDLDDTNLEIVKKLADDEKINIKTQKLYYDKYVGQTVKVETYNGNKFVGTVLEVENDRVLKLKGSFGILLIEIEKINSITTVK